MIVLFDLNGTLTDPAPIGEPWSDPALGWTVLERAVRSGMVDALTGATRPFRDHLAAELDVAVAARGLDPTRTGAALAAASALPARPGAAEALDLLAAGGARLAVLTNSGAEAGERTLHENGLLTRFEAVIGVDAVRSFKPHPSTYRHALEVLGAAPDDVTLVAAHAWDVRGAAACGLRTAWVASGETVLSAVAGEPDVRGADLVEVARALLPAAR